MQVVLIFDLQPSSLKCSVKADMNPCTPNFVAVYGIENGVGWIPDIEQMLTMCPLCFSFICSKKHFVIFKVIRYFITHLRDSNNSTHQQGTKQVYFNHTFNVFWFLVQVVIWHQTRIVDLRYFLEKKILFAVFYFSFLFSNKNWKPIH